MQNKATLIGFASAILILVTASASFSAGLYLGQRGFVANLQSQAQTGNARPFDGPQQPNSQQPGPFDAAQGKPLAGQPNPSGPNPQGGPPNAPSWPPDTMGRLVSLTATALTLDTPQGQVAVAVDASTKFINEAGAEMPSSALKPGDVVAVFGADVAATIMRLPAR